MCRAYVWAKASAQSLFRQLTFRHFASPPLSAGLAALALTLALAAHPAAAEQCEWFGTAPLCNGSCPNGFRDTGERQSCLTGHKVRCCRIECSAKNGRNCKLTGPIGGQICACDEFLKFHVKSHCKVDIEVSVEYIPVNNSATGPGAWHTAKRSLKPEATAQLFQTNNRYVYVSGRSLDGKFVFQRQKVDLGKKLPANHTQNMNCK